MLMRKSVFGFSSKLWNQDLSYKFYNCRTLTAKFYGRTLISQRTLSREPISIVGWYSLSGFGKERILFRKAKCIPERNGVPFRNEKGTGMETKNSFRNDLGTGTESKNVFRKDLGTGMVVRY